MRESKFISERLIAVFIVGAIALNYPLLTLFSKNRLVFGVPILYIYLFALWFVFIVCVAATLEKSRSSRVLSDLKKSE